MSARHLRAVDMPLDAAASRRWHAAVVGAFRQRLRHSAACVERGTAARVWLLTQGCAWCDHILAATETATTNGEAAQ